MLLRIIFLALIILLISCVSPRDGVTVHVAGKTGAGVNHGRWIITAAHVVSNDPTQATVYFEQADVAILPYGTGVKSSIRRTPLTQGALIKVLSPYGVINGVATQNNELSLNERVFPGYSGSPVYDRQDRLVGIVTHYLGRDPKHVLITPSTVILEALRQAENK